jgi:Tetratricopeptide repeat
MRIDLTHPWSRAFFLAAVILCSGILTFSSGKAFLAAHWSASANPELWQKAVRLEPGNAEYWRHLGVLQQWDFEPGRMQQAIRYLQKATEINPRSADLWMELADAYASSGDPVHAQEAFEKAQANYPMSAEVAWRYGGFLLYGGNLSDAYTQIHRAISIDPSLTPSAIAVCWNADADVTTIVDSVLPPKSSYYQEAIDFYLSRNQAGSALVAWNHEQQLGLPTELAHTTPLVNALLEQDRVIEAEQTWQKALKATSWSLDSVVSESRVFNGGFENGVANGGFDWREVPSNGVQFQLDETVVHSGSRSLQIEFDGTSNLDFEHLFQYVAVDPATHYHFSAYLHTEGISTDRGMRFEIFDPRQPTETRVTTPELRGTNPWTPVEADVLTGPSTHILKITLQRVPSWKFDNKLRGTVWVDDVTLTPVVARVEGRSG